jgi:chitinase domain-containing protein 1
MQNFIKVLWTEMKSLSNRLQLFVVIPPYHSYHQEEVVSAKDIELIIRYIDGLSLMTYDYSMSSTGGPNAPIEWMSDNGELILPKCVVARLDPKGLYRSKILMGLNLYGYDYSQSLGRQDVVGNKFLEIVKKNSVTCKWSESDGEVNFTEKLNLAFLQLQPGRRKS